MDKLKKKIITAFKLSGYVIRSENAAYLAEQLLPFEPSEYDKWLTTVIENIQNLKITSTNIDRETIDKAIVEINRVGLQEHETIFDAIDAFNTPRFIYNLQTKKFEHDKRPRSIFPDVQMQIEYLQHRYYMLYQKTIRHELFSPKIIEKSSRENVKKFKLLNVENLLASTEVKEAVIMGQLNEIVEGKMFIEDPTGFVEIDLTETRYHSGFFCEGMFVLAEGSYENKIFKVDGLGFPPAEPASSSRAFFGTANSWGGASEKLLKYSTGLQEAERENTEATMVFLSDVTLDVPEVIVKLRQLFVGYDSCPPVCIVLMGPFSKSSFNLYEAVPYFKELAEAANGCDQLKKETDLVLVPHVYDPIETGIFPRHSLPPTLCKDLIKAWPRTKLMSNPCRLQYCTQQILVVRHNLLSRFARNTIHFPDKKDIDNHFARTLICQGHLMPFDKFKQPVHWDYDSALWMYPLPDLVVIGDNCQSFSTTQHGCTIVNTGSFARAKFTFKMYIPATRTVEDSEIPDGYDEDDQKGDDEIEKDVELGEPVATQEYDARKDILNDGIVAEEEEQVATEENEEVPGLQTEIAENEEDKLQNRAKQLTARDAGFNFEEPAPKIVDIEDMIRPSTSGFKRTEKNIDNFNFDDDQPGVSGLNSKKTFTEEEMRQIKLIENLELDSDTSDEF